jgi:hypothetical protein
MAETVAFGTEFGGLVMEQFRLRMRPHAIAIYERLFGDCEIQDLREEGVRVHVLDKEFGIDMLLTVPSGQWFTVQEKYREHKFLVEPLLQVEPPCPDFTQEYMNAVGTPHESPGEWFKLGAQLYFYGWARPREDGFAAWVLLNVPRYKMIVEKTPGGIAGLGRLCYNRRHGRATFYAIPVSRLRNAWTAQHGLDTSEPR